MGAYSRGMTAGQLTTQFGSDMRDLLLAWEGDYPLNHQPPSNEHNVYSIVGWVVSRLTTEQKEAARAEINRVKAHLVNDTDLAEELNHFLDDSDVIFVLGLDDEGLDHYNRGLMR